MSTLKAKEFCSASAVNNNFETLYSHDRGSKVLTINDDLITTSEVAESRAIAELVKGAYIEKWINLTTLYTQGLKQNDIISAKGFLWIVKEITITYNPPKLLQQVKGIRYE